MFYIVSIFDEYKFEPHFYRGEDAIYQFIKSRIFPPLQLPYFFYNDKKIEILDAQLMNNFSKKLKSGISKNKHSYTLSFPTAKLEIKKFQISDQ